MNHTSTSVCSGLAPTFQSTYISIYKHIYIYTDIYLDIHKYIFIHISEYAYNSQRHVGNTFLASRIHQTPAPRPPYALSPAAAGQTSESAPLQF